MAADNNNCNANDAGRRRMRATLAFLSMALGAQNSPPSRPSHPGICGILIAQNKKKKKLQWWGVGGRQLQLQPMRWWLEWNGIGNGWEWRWMMVSCSPVASENISRDGDRYNGHGTQCSCHARRWGCRHALDSRLKCADCWLRWQTEPQPDYTYRYRNRKPTDQSRTKPMEENLTRCSNYKSSTFCLTNSRHGKMSQHK